jgi:hypothetical protein
MSAAELDQNLVTHQMTKLVVNCLEVIEIDAEQCEGRCRRHEIV